MTRLGFGGSDNSERVGDGSVARVEKSGSVNSERESKTDE